MKKIILTLILFLNLYANQSNSIVVDEVESLMQNGVIIIDIREEKKWEDTGIIPSSYRLTYNDSKIDNNEKRWFYTLIKLIRSKKRTFVLISEDGKKAENLSLKLKNEKGFKKALFLKGGIKAWLDADRRVINY